jgi:hypothetical protein
MVIGSVFRLGPSRGSELIPRVIAAPARGPDIPSFVAPARPAEITAPYPGPLEPHLRVAPPEPARVAAPPPQLPEPADPGALFGLHS